MDRNENKARDRKTWKKCMEVQNEATQDTLQCMKEQGKKKETSLSQLQKYLNLIQIKLKQILRMKIFIIKEIKYLKRFKHKN